MNVKIEKADIFGQINAIPSKSFAHRILIANFLSGKDVDVDCGLFTSKDIEETKNCLLALKNGKNKLDCGESGSTLRFLLPLCAVLGGEYEFVGHGRLMERPNDELFGALSQHGVTAEQTDKITLKGKLTAGEYFIRGDISSQYVTGLLMALPLLDGDSKIILTSPLASAPYVDITKKVLKDFGIEIKCEENCFHIKGGQKYCGNSKVEGDWSNMAFFLSLGAISGQVIVKGLNKESVQGDKAILDILELTGADISFEDGDIIVKKAPLKAFKFDAKDCPDLVPILAVLGAFADGKTVIENVERLKIKESDRIKSTIDTLKAFNISAWSDGHKLEVFGGKTASGKAVSCNDHRIAMAAAVLATGTDGQSEIIDAQAVNKSYPTFYQDLISVGGKVSEI